LTRAFASPARTGTDAAPDRPGPDRFPLLTRAAEREPRVSDPGREPDEGWSGPPGAEEVDGSGLPGPDGADGAQWDREDRQALRRVAGVGSATELNDVGEVEYRRLRLERVVLVGVWTSGGAEEAERSMAELAELARTAGSTVLEALVQRRDKPDPATYIGSGRLEDLKVAVAETGADTVIFDGELTPAQLRTLEDRVKVKVVDRTALILDIFAQHASSKAGKAQVELAQLNYLIQRLRGWGGNLSRTGGGIGTRGPGETRLETDRRRITARMSRLRKELAHLTDTRQVTRSTRQRRSVPAVAIVGYTNAGKSSLLNRLTGAGALVEDALFATLDPAVRRTRTPAGRVVTLADTVGFVAHLPTHLVEAFRSTLEEVAMADVVLHVVDGSHPDPRRQLVVVRQVLADIRAEADKGSKGRRETVAPGTQTEIVVVNKTDRADPMALAALRRDEPGAVLVSAKTGRGIDKLLAAVDGALPQLPHAVEVVLPWDRGDLVEAIRRNGDVTGIDYTEDGSRVSARVGEKLAGALAPYAV